jgi:O-antigen/teichoic acid export membrane protein
MGIPIGAYYVTLNIYNYIDTVMISVIRDSTEVGWYSASYKVYEGLLVLPVIMGTVYLPRMALLNTEDFTGFSGLVRQGWKFSLLLALFVTAAGVPLASDFITIFFGASYSKSVLVMQILLFGAAFAYMVNFLQTVMISSNNQNTLFFIAMGGLVLNVVLNYFLIHLYGFVGAAVVTVFVEGVVFVALGRQVYIRIEGKKHISVLIKALLCWVLLGVFVFMAMRDMSAYVQSALWSIGCVVIWRLLKIVDNDEWERGVALVTRRLWQEMRNE